MQTSRMLQKLRHQEFRGLAGLDVDTVDAAAVEIVRPHNLVLVVDREAVR